MLIVEGMYYFKDYPLQEGGNKYNIVLDVDSISEKDMPIAKSNELILSQIHLTYKIPYQDLSPYFQVQNITTVYPQKRIDILTSIVEDSDFSRNFIRGLKLAYSPDLEDSGNRLGVALEILVKKILSQEEISYTPMTTLGSLLQLLRKNIEIFKDDRQKFVVTNKSRIKSSHHKDDRFTKEDATILADTIIYIAETYFL